MIPSDQASFSSQPPLLHRPRLWNALHFQEGVPVYLIAAPQGYGKTVMVKEFCENASDWLQAIWLSFSDEGEAPSRTWEDWNQDLEIQEKYRERSVSVWMRLVDILLDKPAPDHKISGQDWKSPPESQESLCLLLGEQGRNLRQFSWPLAIILEDCPFHRVSWLSWLIKAAVEFCIPNLYLFFIGRTLPDESCFLYSVENHAAYVTPEQLAFTRQEMEELFLLYRVPQEEQSLDRFYQLTLGWPSAVGWIAALCRKTRLSVLEYKEALIAYARSYVYDRFPMAVRRLLAKMSLFEEDFTLEEAVFIMGTWSGIADLQRLAENRCFITRGTQRGAAVFHLHPLICLAAQRRIDSTDSPMQLFQRRGRWKEGRLDWMGALRSYIKIGDTSRIFRILNHQNCFLFYEQDMALFWIFFSGLSLREKILHSKSYLPYIYTCILWGDFLRGAVLLKEMEKYISLHPRIQDACFAEEQVCLQGEIAILKRLAAFNHLDCMSKYAGQAVCCLKDGASSIFNDRIPLNHGAPEMLSLYHDQSGRLQETVQKLKEYTGRCVQLFHKSDIGWSDLYEAEYALQQGDCETAGALIAPVWKKAVFCRDYDVMANSGLIFMRACLYLGEYTQLRKVLDAMAQAQTEELPPVLLGAFQLATGYIYSIVGKTGNVSPWIQRLDTSVCSNMAKMIHSGYMAAGHILIYQKRYAELEALGTHMCHSIYHTRHVLVLLCGKIYLSIAAEYLHRFALAEQFLYEAFTLAMPDRLKLLFMENGPALLPVLHRLALKEDPPYSSYAADLLPLCRKYGDCLLRLKKSGSVALTRREKEVMEMVSAGHKNAEISRKLNIALVTVEKTLSNVYRKLHVSNRTEAVVRLVQMQNEAVFLKNFGEE